MDGPAINKDEMIGNIHLHNIFRAQRRVSACNHVAWAEPRPYTREPSVVIHIFRYLFCDYISLYLRDLLLKTASQRKTPAFKPTPPHKTLYVALIIVFSRSLASFGFSTNLLYEKL